MSDKCEHKTLIGLPDGSCIHCADCNLPLYEINQDKIQSLERKVKALEAENKNLNDRISHFMFFCSSDQRKYFMDTWDDFSYEQSLSELQAKAIEEVNAFKNSLLMFLTQEQNKAFNSGKLPECHGQLTAMRNLIKQCFAEYAASKRSSD